MDKKKSSNSTSIFACKNLLFLTNFLIKKIVIGGAVIGAIGAIAVSSIFADEQEKEHKK